MASGIAVSGLTDIDGSARQPVGSTYSGPDGKEYVYLLGVASTLAGSWVNYDEDGVTKLAVANDVGPLAVAMAAIVADKYGWYQTKGVHVAARAIVGGACAADVAVFLTATAGRVDDVDVAGDAIHGATTRTAEAASNGLVEVQLDYPYTTNIDYA